MGRYYSDELSSTYDISDAGGSLIVRRLRAAPDTLRVIDRQTFRAGNITLHFATTGARTFTIDNGRARGIEFVKAAPTGK